MPLNKLTRKNDIFKWYEIEHESFERIKNSLLDMPILQYPNFHKRFIITTDASNVACGAVLSQNVNGMDLPIAFASKAFTKGEANKSTIEKKLTAIHWAVKYFRPYLYGTKYIIKTDHKPLVYLYSLKNPSSKLTRMRLDLEEFDFEIEYVKGEANVVADALSRITELQNIKENNSKILKVTTRSMSNKCKVNNENPTNNTLGNKIIIGNQDKNNAQIMKVIKI
jgi:hypothetical protein